MTPTEQARRSDALYYGKVTRRELCDMVSHLESDLGDERNANRYLQEVAASVMYSDYEKLPRICPRLCVTRTDNGCLHCAYLLKLGSLWACVYKEEEDAMEG